METDAGLYYKLAKPDGWDFYTGRTINYRESIGKLVVPPGANAALGLCSPGVLHASKVAEDCFVGARLPCSLYEVRGSPVVGDDHKAGFLALEVVREIDPAQHFKWRYEAAVHPHNPLIAVGVVDEEALALLRQWAGVWEVSVRASGWASVWDTVWASVWEASGWASVRASVWDSVWDTVWASVKVSVWEASGWASVWEASGWASVRASVWDSVGDSVGAYIGWLFQPVVPKWAGGYPYQAAVDLWKRNLVPSYDGHVWRLHTGPDARVVWEGRVKAEAGLA